MSDSFADLWSSSASLPPKPKPQTLASASSSTLGNQPYRSTTGGSSLPDVFSLLAASGQSSQLQPQQQRYGSPNTSSLKTPGGRSNSGTPSPAPALPRSVTSSSRSRGIASAAGSDAFSDLSSSSTQRGGDPLNGNNQNMTIAARMAMESQLKTSKGVRGISQPLKADMGSQDTAWAGLDSLADTGTAFSGGYQSRNTSSSEKLNDEDDWGLGDFGPSAIPTTRTNGLAQPQPQQPLKRLGKGPTTSWDLNEFAPSASGSSSAQQSRPSSQPKFYSQQQQQQQQKSTKELDVGSEDHIPRGSKSVGLLDFDDDVDGLDDFGLGGGQSDTLLHGDDTREGRGDEDDILGMLGQPVETARALVKAQEPPLRENPISDEASYFEDYVPPIISSHKKLKSTTTSSSPPPHVLGQIVEMGFGVEQAKQALAKTTGGIDVQAALEMLLGASEGSGSGDGRQAGGRRGVEAQQQEQLPARTRAPPKGLKERERERLERMRRERERDTSSPSGSGTGDVVSDVQEQADRLLLQASEIGLSVLTKASAFWKEGKERVAKVYEERSVGAAGSQKERLDGRPKWMTDVGSRDDKDVNMRHSGKTRNKQHQRLQPLQDRVMEEEADLNLFDDAPVDLQQGQQRHNRQPSVVPSSVSTAAPLPATRDRPLPTASLSSLSTVCRHKDAGTSQFKLGQYASAVESYTAAINILPQKHLLLIPLLNNRALARMRIGECKGAAEDAGRVLGIVLMIDEGLGEVDGFDPNANRAGVGVQVASSSWHPSIEPSSLLISAQQKANESGWKHPQGLGVDLAEGYVKALRRRAEASEGRERWSEALKDWEVLSAGDGGWIKDQVKKEAQSGSVRCRKMMVDNDTSSAPTSKPTRPKPPIAKIKPSAPTPPSVALRSLQATTAQAEADENMKHQLKDAVDAKLASWRTGKETNIRALLASLDMVLWEEVLKDVKLSGLHELVTPTQVKKGYVKAIAKVHPDKLNAQNSTVEQRMLANGVFGTLNEAWIAFQNS